MTDYTPHPYALLLPALTDDEYGALKADIAEGEHMTRRPLEQVKAAGLDVTERDCLGAGIVERLVAVKPTSAT